MAQLIFAQAKSIYNKANKHANTMRDNLEQAGYPDASEHASNAYSAIIETEREKFRKILEIAKLLHEDYVQIAGRTTENYYFITIRPKPETTFSEFYSLVYKYTKRASMLHYQLAFEQKNLEGNGDGFHVHIVCATKHRSKGECLRDTISTFKDICADNCIEVKTTRNPQDIVKNYLLDYKSQDEHKETTKEADALWRTRLGLAHIYDSVDLQLPPTPGSVHQVPRTEQFSLTFD